MKRSEMLDRSNAKLLRDRIEHPSMRHKKHSPIYSVEVSCTSAESLSHITRPSEAHALLCGMAVGSQPAFCRSRNMTKNDEYERDLDHMCVYVEREVGDQMTRTTTGTHTQTQTHVLETFPIASNNVCIYIYTYPYIMFYHLFIVVTLRFTAQCVMHGNT